MDGPGTVKGRIYQLEKDIAIASASTNVTTTNAIQFENLTESRFKWMLAFGVGTVLLSVGRTILKVYNFDVAQEKRMCIYIQNVVNNLENVIKSKIENLEKVTISKIDHLSNKLDTISEGKKT